MPKFNFFYKLIKNYIDTNYSIFLFHFHYQHEKIYEIWCDQSTLNTSYYDSTKYQNKFLRKPRIIRYYINSEFWPCAPRSPPICPRPPLSLIPLPRYSEISFRYRLNAWQISTKALATVVSPLQKTTMKVYIRMRISTLNVYSCEKSTQ